MKIYHTVNLVAEIDETKMPSQLLHLFTGLPEEKMKRMLSQVFVSAITEIGALDKINEDNTYAVVKFVNN